MQVVDAAQPVEGDVDTLDFPPLRGVRFFRLAGLRVAEAAPPDEAEIVARVDDRPALAVGPGRRVWLGFDAEDFDQRAAASMRARRSMPPPRRPPSKPPAADHRWCRFWQAAA